MKPILPGSLCGSGPYMCDVDIILPPIESAWDLHMSFTWFLVIIMCILSLDIPAIFAFIWSWVIYIFVFMLTPTIGSPALHEGIFCIIEPCMPELAAKLGALETASKIAANVTIPNFFMRLLIGSFEPDVIFLNDLYLYPYALRRILSR